MAQTFFYPNPTITSSSPTAGTPGSPAPSQADYIAGKGPTGLLVPVSVDASGNVNVTSTSTLPVSGTVTANQGTAGASPWLFLLPTGASTSALQTTGNTSLASIDGKTPALGQALAAASVPVVLTAAQITTLTPITGGATAANQTTMLARLSGSLVPAAYDEIDLTYITSGNGTGSIGTAVYKLLGATVKTLTLTYDASNRLSTTVAT